MEKFYQNNEKTTDTWLTPISLINELGFFQTDPCTPKNMPWKTADIMYCLEDGQDGLVLPWKGRCWINPPYSDWGKWLKKLSEHGNGIALIFNRLETASYFDYVWDKASSIVFLKKRIKFCRLDGSFGGGSTCGSCLIGYGANNDLVLKDFADKFGHKYIKLK